MRRPIGSLAILLLLVAGHAGAQSNDGAIISVKMGLDSLSAGDQTKLWSRLDDYAKADSILEFCGRKLNLYKRTWNALSPCVETPALRKVGASFLAKKSKYLEILGGNYPDAEKKKVFCDGFQTQMKSYATIIDKDIAEARGMCDACMWC